MPDQQNNVPPAGSLEQRLIALLESTEGIRSEIRVENVKRDKRIRTNQIAIIITSILGVIGISVGAAGFHSQQVANRNNAKARIASCLQYNQQQKDNAEIDIHDSHDLIALAIASNPKSKTANPKTIKKFEDRFNKVHDASIRFRHAQHYRDCSPAGIRKYLSAQPKS